MLWVDTLHTLMMNIAKDSVRVIYPHSYLPTELINKEIMMKITMDVYYVQLQDNVSKLFSWLTWHSDWFRYKIAFKRPIWQVYDTSDNRVIDRNHSYYDACKKKELREELRYLAIQEDKKINEIKALIEELGGESAMKDIASIARSLQAKAEA
tara:strand:- start:279 stop:737 length:459 start_codon:yes stop_codon:yes gene_type:complete